MTRLERTPSQTVGPYLHVAMLDRFAGELSDEASAGSIVVCGAVLDGAGEAVVDAVVELWQASADGRYTPDPARFGRSDTRTGEFRFRTVRPGAVSSPEGLQAPHLVLGVFARGLLKRAVTRMYFPDAAEANAADPVLSGIAPPRRGTLVAALEADGSLRFDIRLQGEHGTVFFAP